MRRRALLGIAFVEFAGAAGFGVLLPMLPALGSRLGFGRGGGAVLIVSYFVAGALGYAVLGWMADRWGRKPVLVGSVVLAIESLILLAWANDVALLMMARVAAGFAIGVIRVTEAVRRELPPPADAAERKTSARLAHLVAALCAGFAAGLGLAFVLGPASVSPAYAAATLAAASLVALEALVPETRRARPRKAAAACPDPGGRTSRDVPRATG